MTAVLRVVPMTLRTARRPQRLLERAYIYNRRMWIIIVSGFFEPLFYLLSMRAGVGAAECAECRCDVNSAGGISATDALLILRAAVGQPVALTCPSC